MEDAGEVQEKPFVCDVAITFESARHAEIANNSLSVDEELQPHKVTRTSVVRRRNSYLRETLLTTMEKLASPSRRKMM